MHGLQDASFTSRACQRMGIGSAYEIIKDAFYMALDNAAGCCIFSTGEWTKMFHKQSWLKKLQSDIFMTGTEKRLD